MIRRRDKIPLFLAAGCCFLCWLFVMRQGVFGSEIDWISQHSVLPDYFRQRFYDTKELFPSFAPNLGGGQNIYHFSYYGLYSPILLISYLLPFVKMSDYIICSSICCYISSVVLFYLWIRKKCESRVEAVGIACMFGLATPLLYHAYNQLMFVNYMPFLCLALMGTDRYLEKKRSKMLVIGTFCMILTSFYFSIGGMLVLIFYGSSEYCKQAKPLTMRGFLACGTGFLFRLGISILMSGVLLIPTACALGGGRTGKIELQPAWFLPDFSPMRILYSPHGLGLTSFALTVLLTGVFYQSWKERLLSLELLMLLLFPVFGYLLNGGLYSKDKVFIPCLPVICSLIIPYLKELRKNGKKLRFVLPYLITPALISISRSESGFAKYWIYSFGEAVLMILLFVILLHFQKTVLLPYCAGVVLLITGYGINTIADVSVEKDFYQETTSTVYRDLMQEIAGKDSAFYRMEQLGSNTENKANLNRIHTLNQYVSSLYSSSYNPFYQAFRKETMALNEPFRNDMMQSVTDNPMFLSFMGVKYLISDEPLAGYQLFLEKDGHKVWKNEYAAPVIYATNQLMEENLYKALKFPQNQSALLETAVVPKRQNSPVKESGTVRNNQSFKDITFTLPDTEQDALKIEPIAGGYEITAKKASKVTVDLASGNADELLALDFQVENLHPSRDMYIKLENQTNRLSASQHVYANHNDEFTYLITKQPNDCQVTLTFGKGNYRISRIMAYTGSLSQIQKDGLYQNPFHINWRESKGDQIQGSITASEGSYLITSIPFDKNFSVFVDGRKVPTEIVNTAFLGCKLTEGKHQVQIIYHAGGLTPGIWVSFLGGFLFLVVEWITFRRKKVIYKVP